MTDFVTVSLGLRCYVLGELRGWAVSWSPPATDLDQMAKRVVRVTSCAVWICWEHVCPKWFQLSPQSKLSFFFPFVIRGWGHLNNAHSLLHGHQQGGRLSSCRRRPSEPGRQLACVCQKAVDAEVWRCYEELLFNGFNLNTNYKMKPLYLGKILLM